MEHNLVSSSGNLVITTDHNSAYLLTTTAYSSATTGICADCQKDKRKHVPSKANTQDLIYKS